MSKVLITSHPNHGKNAPISHSQKELPTVLEPLLKKSNKRPHPLEPLRPAVDGLGVVGEHTDFSGHYHWTEKQKHAVVILISLNLTNACIFRLFTESLP